MRKFSRAWAHAIICAAVALFVAGFYALELKGHGGSFLLGLEYGFRDKITKAGRFNPPDPRLVYLGIDNASVSLTQLDLKTLFADVTEGSPEARALEVMSGGWPWSREVHALIAERLLDAGATVVVFDLLFLKEGPGDEALRGAIEKFPGRIILASNFVPDEMGAGDVAWSLPPPTSSIVPDPSAVAAQIGYVNFFTDLGGVTRTVRYWTLPEQLAPPRNQKTADELRAALKSRTPQAQDPAAISMRAALAARLGTLAEPFESKLIRFTGPPGTFLPIPVYQLFAPGYWQKNFSSGTVFQNKIIFVGPAGNWQHDEHPTAFGQMPGPELHLNALNAVLHQAFIQAWPDSLGIPLLLALVLLSWILTICLRRIWWRLAAFVVVAGLFFLVVNLAYNFANLVVPAIAPVLAFSLSGFVSFAYDFALETLDKLRMRRTLEAYVSKDVVREVLDNPDSYLRSLGGERKCAAVLLTDLRNFTALSEQMDSAQLVMQLNEYLSVMVEDIFAHRGSVDKFIGDAILAVWGHLNTEGATKDIALALRASLQMQQSLRKLNTSWKERGMRNLAMGCGINYGEVIFGNIGSSQKMEPTVIGDAVNVTSRLESLTKEYGREILLGENAAKHVRDLFTLQFVDRVAVRGKTQAFDFYTVIPESNQSESLGVYLQTYAEAIEFYRNSSFAKAQTLFEECLKQQPNDSLATIYRERCLTCAAHPPAKEWQGIHQASA